MIARSPAQDGRKPLAGDDAAEGREFEIFLVDFTVSLASLEQEEANTPRLSAADIARAETLALDGQRQRLWRASRIAIRIALERVGGAGLRGEPFEIQAAGRPVLAGGEGPFFSVSHCDDASLIAVSTKHTLGVDLEKKRDLAISNERRQRIIAAAQMAALPTLRAEHDDDVLRAWVRLEAEAKARGTGIGQVLTARGIIGGRGRNPPKDTGHLLQIADLDVGDYMGAVAALELPPRVTVRPFPTAHLSAFATGR